MKEPLDRGLRAIIIHGGAGTFGETNSLIERHIAGQTEGLRSIIAAGWELLNAGAPALDVVEKTINLLEDHPNFNAGIGAALGLEKQIELDASIMDGRDLSCGAVAALSNIVHAISVARKVMECSGHVLLMGGGADRFAQQSGFTRLPTEAFLTDIQLFWWEKFQLSAEHSPIKGTVGAVVRDEAGNIAAGTSTGGMSCKLPGRVGDSPLIGAGTYADNAYGGFSATGYGEQIIRTALTKTAVDLMRWQQLDAQQACEGALADLARLKNGKGGLIGLGRDGSMGACSNETHFPVAWMSAKLSHHEISCCPNSAFRS